MEGGMDGGREGGRGGEGVTEAGTEVGREGGPITLLTDKGSEFLNRALQKLLKE